jgi:hypothetical protein
MTAKEKAVELYNKFRNENAVLSANVRAKKQALIACDEILRLACLNDTDGYTGSNTEKYWQQVKQEIEKL